MPYRKLIKSYYYVFCKSNSGEIMENSKALLNFDVFGWFTVIIQIQIRVLCK